MEKIISYDNFIKLGEEQIDEYIIKLHEALNTSDNWIDTYWSLETIIENIKTGCFDITIDDKNNLFIFGTYVDEINDRIKKILTGLE